jgi:hypothetical protein
MRIHNKSWQYLQQPASFLMFSLASPTVVNSSNLAGTSCLLSSFFFLSGDVACSVSCSRGARAPAGTAYMGKHYRTFQTKLTWPSNHGYLKNKAQKPR